MTVIWFIDDSIVGGLVAQDSFDVIFTKQSAINLNVINVFACYGRAREQASQTEFGFELGQSQAQTREQYRKMAFNNNNNNN